MPSDPYPAPVVGAESGPADRSLLRSKLRAAREAFVVSESRAKAEEALARYLRETLNRLEPECLGLYWPIRSEFNAVSALAADPALRTLPWALPYTLRADRQMHYRTWDGGAPAVRDESGLPSSDGRPVLPDVVLVPCLGYTGDGYRLGYGAGYFDRWLAAHPQVTAVGVAWAIGRLGGGEFEPQAHDQPMPLVITERGVAGG
jgi:5,10-methenyltetrahydrofolate synthetase